MSTHIKIMSPQAILTFNTPPEFNGEARKKFFSPPVWAKKTLNELRTPVNKIGFILQLGYFRAVNKFFSYERFHQKDVDFVAHRLQILLHDVELSTYASTSLERHQDIILNAFGWRKWNEDTRERLIQEALLLCAKQTKPRLMFLSLVDFLRDKKIQIPTYHALSEIITQTLHTFEKTLILSLEQTLSEEDKQLLNELLKAEDESVDEKKQDGKLKKYRLLNSSLRDQRTIV